MARTAASTRTASGARSAASSFQVQVGQNAPLEIRKPSFYIAADRVTGIADGGVLTTWTDESPSRNNFTQATAGFKPLFFSTTGAELANGFATVKFDGTDDTMASPTLASIGGSNVSTLIVAQPVTLAADQEVFEDSIDNFHDKILSTGSYEVKGGSTATLGSGIAANTTFIIVMKRQGGNVVAFLNGARFTGTIGNTTFAFPTNLAKAAAGFGNIRLIEFAMWDSALTESEMLEMCSTYANKYDVSF